MEELEQSVQALTKQLDDAKNELNRFREMDAVDLLMTSDYFKDACQEGQRIVFFIMEAVTSYDEASCDEQRLRFLLHMFWSNMDLIADAASSQVEKLFHPRIQLLIIGALGLGPVTNDTPVLRFIPAAPWWDSYCTSQQLTREQISHIDNTQVKSTGSANASVWRS
eukprot:TRINITY_DN17331_c0_g1_i1.p1 TRINITY_DN17331_c0_g1~~TRINITY_DN17331_c0_g1_i1.p1  ORF type:complete len:166 (-),score=26.56 TRINITY_DN17331_c0_g1_i1:215-712(-)